VRSLRGFTVCALLSVAALATATGAQADERAEGEADFIGICPVALLDAAQLSSALGARGLVRAANAKPAATWDATIYESAGSKRSVTVNRQSFSDFSMASCLVSISAPMSLAELGSLRAHLEGQRTIGKLEGEVVQATPAFQLALLKRPGNSPIVTVNVSSTLTSTTLMINRWDLRAPK
jgi:hypothetical protein